jgi:pyruvate dehydrogenase E1 component alpha subunit
MPAVRIEDNDVEAVYDAAGRAVARARAGEGPSLIEVHTLRMWGHFEGDAQGYRPELAEVPARDPIPRYERTLRDRGVLDDDGVAATKKDCQDRVEEAIAFAKGSPLPDPAAATSYVFA